MVERVEEDWKKLTGDLNITKEPSYAHHNGKPVVALWGMGFADRPITSQQSATLINFFGAHWREIPMPTPNGPAFTDRSTS
jgi:hypothetical protein